MLTGISRPGYVGDVVEKQAGLSTMFREVFGTIGCIASEPGWHSRVGLSILLCRDANDCVRAQQQVEIIHFGNYPLFGLTAWTLLPRAMPQNSNSIPNKKVRDGMVLVIHKHNT